MVDKAMDPSELKSFFNAALIEEMGQAIQGVHPAFDAAGFSSTASNGIELLELKARSAQICRTMGQYLPAEFAAAVGILERAMGNPGPPRDVEIMGGFQFWPHVTFLSEYGLNEPDVALRAMKEFTKHCSCEFAIRFFLIEHRERTMKHVAAWVVDEDWRVRRLASEGTRPRLPWGQQLKDFVADPSPVEVLLDGLHDDPELVVRRSVANNLNDIAKDHPDRAAAIAKRWYATGKKGSQWTVKHGLRSLVKQGHADALAVLGFEGGDKVAVEALSVTPADPKIGGASEMAFTLRNGEAEAVNLVVDYALDRMLANGKRGEKVFKLKILTLEPGETASLRTNLRFKQLSTRTYYPGPHSVTVLINGRPAGTASFPLGAA